MEGGGVGGCGEERVDVNNVTVGGVGRSERTDMTMDLKDGSVRGRRRGTALLLSNVRDCEVTGVQEDGERAGSRRRVT